MTNILESYESKIKNRLPKLFLTSNSYFENSGGK